MAQPNYPAGPSILLTLASLTVTSGGGTQDVAADSDRIELWVSNYDATLAIYVRDTASTATAGTKVNAGETAYLSTSAAVRIVNPGGSNVTVGLNSLKTP